MHRVVEKTNSTESTTTMATAAHVKTSKKKSKSHRKTNPKSNSTEQSSTQNDDNDDMTNHDDKRRSGKATTTNGTASTTTTNNNNRAKNQNGQTTMTNLKDLGNDQSDDCLHIRENGCVSSEHKQPVVANGEMKVSTKNSKNRKCKNKSSKGNSIENGETKRDGNEEHQENGIKNGTVSHEEEDEINEMETTPPKLSNSATATELTASMQQPSVSSPCSSSSSSSASHPEPVIVPPSSTSSSSTSTEQISNKNECQGLELGTASKTVVSPTVVEPTIQPASDSDATIGAEGGTLDSSNIVIEYKQYESELQMQDIMRLIQSELSEPYSIYTYRYFIYNWPKLCFLAAHGNEYVGAIVCKLDMHMNVKRGYIAMLAVKREYRKLKIGTNLVQKAIEAMLADDADEVVLETEMKNIPALRLYENLGFVRDKRLFRYYLNGVDALRLKLWFR